MKKHQFLQVEWLATVKLTPAERRKIEQWLVMASGVMEKLVGEGLIKGKPRLLRVSLLICGDTRIRILNRNHREKDKVTDVLSFPAYENLRKNQEGEELFLGDLAISWPQTKRQAREFEITPMDEFIHLFFHGVLHLLGYDHEASAKEEKIMQTLEDKSLELFAKVRKM